METKQLLTWQDFLDTLQQHPELVLQFEYAHQQRVAPSYHITEVKQAPITSVDCGGVMNSWTEVIVQLWEPAQAETDRAMQVNKALRIFDLVASKLPLHPAGIVKIEFGNLQYDTRQMYPAAFHIEEESLVVMLTADQTQCKAINRGGTCGTGTVNTTTKPEPANACCTPESSCC